MRRVRKQYVSISFFFLQFFFFSRRGSRYPFWADNDTNTEVHEAFVVCSSRPLAGAMESLRQ